MKNDKDFDDSKLNDTDINLNSSNRFIKALDNFWFYHKWKVIIISFFAVVLVICILQMVGKERIDDNVVIGVPKTLYAEEIAELDNTLTSLMPKDENGEKNLALMIYPIYSEDELEYVNELETNDEGNYVTLVSPVYNAEKISEYSDYMMTGEASLLFVSPYLYAQQAENDRLMPLSEIFGENVPKSGYEYGVRLGDTYLYEYFDAFKVLPEDTVICLRRAYVMGASANKERYQRTKEFFVNLVTFGD